MTILTNTNRDDLLKKKKEKKTRDTLLTITYLQGLFLYHGCNTHTRKKYIIKRPTEGKQGSTGCLKQLLTFPIFLNEWRVYLSPSQHEVRYYKHSLS